MMKSIRGKSCEEFVDGPALRLPDVIDPPPVTALSLRQEIVHVSAIQYGVRPPTTWVLTQSHTERILPPHVAPDAELATLAARLNEAVPDAVLSDSERSMAIRVAEKPLGYLDQDHRIYETRRVDAYGRSGGRGYSRRDLRDAGRALSAWLDEVNGTVDVLIPLTVAEEKAQAAAAAAARVEAEQRAADLAAYERAFGSYLDSQNANLPARLRMANVAQFVLAFAENRRLFDVAEREQAFFDATGKDFSEHGDDYTAT